MEELFDLIDLQVTCVGLPNNIGNTTDEMQILYQEEFPYYYLSTIDGQCLIWDEAFINKCLVAMSTGSLVEFSDIEEQIWKQFVEFQNALTHSANTEVYDAIGCTVPNESGISFVVTNSGITNIQCEEPLSSVLKENQSKSLDEYFMSLYNCETPNDCGIIQGDVEDISPCPIQ